MESKASIHVEVVFGVGPREIRRVELDLPVGTTLAQALHSSGVLSDIAPEQHRALETGVWGRKLAASHALRDRDRVEIYRPLTVDPKVARRERFARQGAKTAGLFAKRRAGAKSGY